MVSSRAGADAWRQWRRLMLVAIFSTVFTSLPAEAQYFGQNKVRYADLDFKVLETEHFDIHYYPEEEEAIRDVARMAERWYARLSAVIGLEFTRRQPLIMYASHPHFRETNAIPGFLGPTTGGVTEGFKRRVVMPFAAGMGETDHVLGHELVHAFQYALRERGARRMLALPLWFIEGMAEYLSVGPVDPDTAMWIRDAAASESLPTIPDLSRRRYFPYRWGHALWAYLAGRFGDDVIGQTLVAGGVGGDPIGAIESVTGVDIDTLSADWQAAIRRWASGRPLAASTGSRPVITEDTSGGSLNVGPALSPDGQHVAFLSERDLFAIEMFLADATTGRVTKKIVETATDPHFDNLQFVTSAGAWSPDGERFAFASVQQGRPVLTVATMPSGEVVDAIPLPELGEIYTPTWSPDGQQIAFTGMKGGWSDLYVYDLRRRVLRQLTSDAFADLHPAWSPDGAYIAFATDRFTTDLARLRFGDYRLALADPTTGRVRAIDGFRQGKHINPQWSPDGQRLYFIAAPDGVANVYQLTLATGITARLTDAAAGVSGITATSPALSAARTVDRLALTLYRNGRHEIHTLDPTAVRFSVPRQSDGRAGALPPTDRARGQVARLLADATFGLPAPRPPATRDYHTNLDLDYIGQPEVMIGRDAMSTFVGGGVSFLFSDMLGNHSLGTAIQITGDSETFDDLGGQVSYLNRTSRWNWGIAFEQLPFVTQGFQESLGSANGQPILTENRIRFRQVNRRVLGLASYPFNRGLRFEFTGGVRRIGFAQEVRSRAFDLQTGRLLAEDTFSQPAPGALTFGEFGAALVGDSSILGPNGPIQGQRYRFEVAPTFGDLQFTTVQADYRHYVVPFRPFTVAARLLHVGRYGQDARDSRLTPLFLGYPNLVRGYEPRSFTADECAPSAETGCDALDPLVGTRMAVANLELRFPLVGAFTGDFDYGPLPVDGVVFTDAGVAWTATDGPTVFGGARRVVKSWGVGLRANLFGAALLEIDLVRPLDRPRDDWMLAFAFRQGF